jgi:hypothetical protein
MESQGAKKNIYQSQGRFARIKLLKCQNMFLSAVPTLALLMSTFSVAQD